MRLEHPSHPGRAVRLGYCLNLHPAEDLDGVLAGLRDVTLPLARRVGGGAAFGVGPWLAGPLARVLASPAGAAGRERLGAFLAEHRLEPFTFNAFPFGGFHRPGLKRDVFRPTWAEPERLAYTLDVARVAAAVAAPEDAPREHVSVSTHAGAFGAWVSGDGEREAIAANLATCLRDLAALRERSGVRVVLSIEPEPRSSANDTAALPALDEALRARAGEAAREHLNTCLDACHAAVEFEEPAAALANATAAAALGKLQFSSALSVAHPAADAGARAALLALHEPVFLHQVTGRGPGGLVRTDDLDELAVRCDEPAWRACDEWRCHFHLPVDRVHLEAGGARLATTRSTADRLLALALADPARWPARLGTAELHVEIETYTWSVLPHSARATTPASLVDGLEREYHHVLRLLADAGWHPRNPRPGV